MSYVDFLNLTEDRQRQLKNQYFFDCTCQSCKDHYKDDLKLAGQEVDEQGEKVKNIVFFIGVNSCITVYYTFFNCFCHIYHYFLDISEVSV